MVEFLFFARFVGLLQNRHDELGTLADTAGPALRHGLELGVEALGHALLHDEARARATDLALVEPDRIDQPLDSRIQIGILEDDVGRLAPKLERQGLAASGGGGAG